VQFLGLGLQLLEASLCIDKDCIFGLLSQIKLRLERLRRLLLVSVYPKNPTNPLDHDQAYPDDALLEAFEAHPPPW
jgi:hypothetical protein